MDKFLYFTDIHYGAKPVNRKDNYNESILSKVRFILTVCEKNGLIPLNGGDLFDSIKLGFLYLHKLVLLLQEFKDRGIVIRTIKGNDQHDGAEDASPLEMLASVGLVELIDGFLDFNETRIIGASHRDDAVMASLKYGTNDKTNILLTHLTLTEEPIIFEHCLWKDFIVPVEIVCVAHYHPYQGVKYMKDTSREKKMPPSGAGRGGAAAGTGDENGGDGARNGPPAPSPAPRAPVAGRWFVAPGAVARRKKTKHDLDRIPKAVYIQVNGKALKFQEINIKCEKDIWVNNFRLEIEEEISNNVQILEEINNMKKTMDDTIVMSSSLEDALQVFAKNKNVSDDTLKFVLKRIGSM